METLADKYVTFSGETKKLLAPGLIETMADTFNKVYPAICDFFNGGEIRNVVFEPDPDFDLPPSLIIVTDDADGSMTANNTIKFKPDDIVCQEGVWSVDWMTHELVHVAQDYKYGNSGIYPHWIVEGLADYGGAKFVGLYKKDADWYIPKIIGNKKNYELGYRAAAGFFIWLEENIDETLPQDLNNTVKSCKYNDNYFVEKTGKSADELWKMYAEKNGADFCMWLEKYISISLPEDIHGKIKSGNLDDELDNYLVGKTGRNIDDLWELWHK